MADYKKAEAKTGGNEGGYANNPKDRGKETFSGISRLYHPNSKVWPIIDEIKRLYLPTGTDLSTKAARKLIDAAAFAYYPILPGIVSSFYKANFWNVNSLDQFRDQQLAETVYDFGVNAGTERAADFLQDAYNNIRKGFGWFNKPALVNDGEIGRKTLEAVNGINAAVLHKEYNRLREAHYRSEATKPGQKDFLAGWLKRLKPYVNV